MRFALPDNRVVGSRDPVPGVAGTIRHEPYYYFQMPFWGAHEEQETLPSPPRGPNRAQRRAAAREARRWAVAGR